MFRRMAYAPARRYGARLDLPAISIKVAPEARPS